MDGGAWWATIHGVTKSQIQRREQSNILKNNIRLYVGGDIGGLLGLEILDSTRLDIRPLQ